LLNFASYFFPNFASHDLAYFLSSNFASHDLAYFLSSNFASHDLVYFLSSNFASYLRRMSRWRWHIQSQPGQKEKLQMDEQTS